MRTSNFFSIAALVICGMVCVNSVKAEGTPTNSNQVTVNLKFKPVQSIVVNSDSKIVDLEYITEEDYNKGVFKTITDHLIVFSTGGFVVSVEALSENFTRKGEGDTKTIPLEDVIIRAVNGTNTAKADFSDVELSTDPSALITSNAGGNELKYSVTYDNTNAGSGYKYINRYIHDDTESVYKAQVTYTITTN